MEIVAWAGLVVGVALLTLTWHSVIVTTIQPRTGASYITFLGWASVNAIVQFLALLAPISLLMMLVV
jgi:hypothetical protein